MSTMTEKVGQATTTAVSVPTWATLKASYRQAESSGIKATRKAQETVVRAYALTDETVTDAKSGAVTARSESERSREVLDALNIVSGNVFGLSAMRVAQLVKVFRAIALSGVDPFSGAGQQVFTSWDAIRKADVTSLESHAADVKTAESKAVALSEAVESAKKVAKDRAAANKAKKDADAPTMVTVTGLSQVVAFANQALPMVRKVSATATPEEKAEARKALEALIAHLQ
jgi:hypothetical protein